VLELHKLRDIYDIGRKLQKELTDTVLNSHLSMENLTVSIYITFDNNMVRFDRRLERINTCNYALETSFYFDTKHLFVKRTVLFNRAEFLFKQLTEVL